MRRLISIICLGLVFLILLSIVTEAKEFTKSEQIITFTNQSKFDSSIILDLPAEAKISQFNFELTGPVDPGSEQPWNLTLDISANGTIDWALPQEYGPLGYQKVFDSGGEELERRFIPGNYNSTGGIYLPFTIDISKAQMKLEYTPENYISPTVTELNRPEWHPEAPYDYDPEMCVYQDRLFVAYRTYSWRDTNSSDADIVINSTADGIHWQDRTIELTKAPDTEIPYTGGKRAGDFYPSLVAFKGHLYCAWESDGALPIGSTNGDDRDILWTRFDGVKWEEPQELTAPTENAAEDKYSENPGVKDDYRVQLCTFDNGTSEQLFAIWTANNTGDEEFPEERKGDIVISRTTDGKHWTTGFDLTAGDRRFDEDNLPQLVEFNTSFGNALFAFWVSNNEKFTDGADWDIVYRFTLDGVSWSEQYNLLEECNVTESDDNPEAIDDDPSVMVFDGQLYVFWRTSNPEITEGNDIDIVMTHSSDGINWAYPIELTPSDDFAFNNRPKAVGFQDQLAVTWVSWREGNTDAFGSLSLKVFDNNLDQWLEPITLSLPNDEVNDYSLDIITFNDRIMLAWVSQDNITTPGAESDVVVRGVIPRYGIPEIGLNIGSKDEYNKDWFLTKRKFSVNDELTLDFTELLQNLLQNDAWVNEHMMNDEFGNEMIYLPINSYFSSPGLITLDSLQIQYNYSFLSPDLGEELSEYFKKYSKIDGGDKDVQIPLRFESDSNGKIKIANLKVVYTEESESSQVYEFICIIILAIILIIIGIFLKFSGPQKPKPKEPDRKSE